MAKEKAEIEILHARMIVFVGCTIAFINIVLANANELGVECVLDYIAPFGRGWRCDRQKWQKYTKQTIHGVPGDWLHIEITPQMADSPSLVKQAFNQVFTELPQ